MVLGLLVALSQLVIGESVGHADELFQIRQFSPIVDRMSKEYQIDPHWVLAVIWKESGGDRDTWRVETKIKRFYRPTHFAQINRTSLFTEIEGQRIAWGLGQVTGVLAREQGYTGQLPGLTDPETNIRHMCIRLAYLKTVCQHYPTDIFAFYNGGPGMRRSAQGHYRNDEYVWDVMRRLELVRPK